MIRYFLPLFGSFLGHGLSDYIFFPVLVLSFVATLPCVFRQLFRR